MNFHNLFGIKELRIVSLNIGHTTITVLVITLITIEEPVPKRGKSSASSEVGQSVTTTPRTADGIYYFLVK